jgi:hypothetical protein
MNVFDGGDCLLGSCAVQFTSVSEVFTASIIKANYGGSKHL